MLPTPEIVNAAVRRFGTVGGMGMHVDELRVTVAMVRELVAAQFPEWADWPIAPVASDGTVNAIFRIGDRLAARFPLAPGDVDRTWQWLAVGG